MKIEREDMLESQEKNNIGGDDKDSSNQIFIVSYNIKTENNSDIEDEDEKQRLNNLRHRIVYNLKNKFEALNVRKGQWVVLPEEINNEELREKVSEWDEAYSDYPRSNVNLVKVNLNKNFSVPIEEGMYNLLDKLKNLKKDILDLKQNQDKVNSEKVDNLKDKCVSIEETFELFEDKYKKYSNESEDLINNLKEEIDNCYMSIFGLYDYA